MKKNYFRPRMTVIDCNVEVLQIRGSLICGDGLDGRPEMGTDGEGEYDTSHFWNELN